MEFQDKTIVCVSCGEEFVWAAGPQQFFYDYNLSPPRRCPECIKDRKRKMHRQRREEEQRVREVQHD